MIKRFFLASTVALAGFHGAAALADTDRGADLVAACVAQTGSAGSYALQEGTGFPRVVPASGGTSRGAAVVNDCLEDKYAVQYDAVDGRVVAVTGTVSAQEQCEEARSQRVGLGLLLSAATVAIVGGGDAAVVGGVLGTAAGIRSINQDYSDCLARAKFGETSVVSVYSCRAGASLLQGGNGYCRR